MKLDEGDDGEAAYERGEVGDGFELLRFLLDVAAVLLRVPQPDPPRVLQYALLDVLASPLAVLLPPQVLEVPPVSFLDSEFHVLRPPLAVFAPPLALLLAPRARQRRIERAEERLRVCGVGRVVRYGEIRSGDAGLGRVGTRRR